MRLSTLFSLLFVSFSTLAGGLPAGVYQHSDDTLQKLYSELHYLNQAGREIHQKYDDKIKADPSQMRFCQGEYGYISSRAKATIGIANRLDSPNKEEYIATGWKAFECIKCSGEVSHCDAIPPTLETIKAEYKARQ
ncbi:hypothetical protein [Methylophaga sp.]|uniref:hypothetical protein n=1 Tax=Methylophaga sp. TaxID=2024840 RepID=UPI001401106B|nr:hypothetical protein [Methylophaga sp.]MTI63953.1 hypothetical protein [Methylophaga sp.]